ncbi:hypothetical protein [Roseibacillus ishigakijimensis]|uniref:Uncharacterized protein n=1 Tax=Roseibacillus ishigakijimensis TaxID=454146 RepID=A0A934RS99_9BACT|nr:hypothetical protein [Roseibacillus ishigakijimensis]MBK1834523.1 hypothetical protein [Roseibacillus ishigakijimensis]
MKANFLPMALTALLSLSSRLPAAPATELPHEWFVPHETRNGFSLVESESGQVRHFTVAANGSVTVSAPVRTDLANLSGLASGYRAGTTEYLVLSSKTSNGLRLLPVTGSSPLSIQSSDRGPKSAVPLHPPATTSSLLVHATYADNGHSVEMINTPHATPTFGAHFGNLLGLSQLQGLRHPDTNARWAVATYASIPPQLIEFIPLSTTNLTSNSLGNVRPDSKLTTEVRGTDGRTCTLAYLPGSPTVEIFTHKFGPFLDGKATSPALPFAVGSIAALPAGIPNAPDGVIITSHDGRQAAYAGVVNGSSFTIRQTFTTNASRPYAGVLPVPGRGLIQLLGDAHSRRSIEWTYLNHSGTQFATVQSGALADWLPPSGEFATLFWFDKRPLVNSDAQIVALQPRPDWTNGAGAPGTTLSVETYLSPSAGLTNPTNITPATPAGANYVLANQFLPNASVSALADNTALLAPSFRVSPESGSYGEAVTVDVLYDETTLEIYYREDVPAASWQLFGDALTIGYPSDWAFFAKEKASGREGPITTRRYTFTTAPDDLDSDGDGVPDYVEQEFGLDPAGGADSDLDFQSDLEEILAGTDPNDPDSNVAAGSRTPPHLGEGFYLYAQAFNQTTGAASPFNDNGTATTEDDYPGVLLKAHDMRGLALANANVRAITEAPLSGQNGAKLPVTSPLAEREWLILSTPIYFDLGTGSNRPRNGRETYRVLNRPVFPSLAEGNAFVASGDNRAADAAGWVAGMQTAAANYQPISALTRLDPLDNAVAILAEQALFTALQGLPEAATLGVPADIADFTLFGSRPYDSGKTPLDEGMIRALLTAGCDFRDLLTLLDSGVRGSTPIKNLANQIYARHAAVSASNPSMALPLDALRSVLRTGAITDPGASVAIFDEEGNVVGNSTRPNPYNTIGSSLRSNARSAMNTLLGNVPGTKRPVDTWTVVIEPSTTPGHRYHYRRSNGGNLALFVDSFGDRFLLEQGLGLNLGAQFTVTGYLDVDPVAGFDTMEILSIDFVVVPTASDRDSNGNLLDDEWELFFFGELGAHGPYDEHPVTGINYLQYHLSGVDPRSNEVPDLIPDLLPSDIELVWKEAFNAYDIEFTFPDAYLSSFTFEVHSSTDLTGFSGPVNVGGVTSLGGNRHALRISVPQSGLPRNFFQIQVSLAD